MPRSFARCSLFLPGKQEVKTVTDFKMGDIFKMKDTLRSVYDPNLLKKKGRKKSQIRIVGSDREL